MVIVPNLILAFRGKPNDLGTWRGWRPLPWSGSPGFPGGHSLRGTLSGLLGKTTEARLPGQHQIWGASLAFPETHSVAAHFRFCSGCRMVNHGQIGMIEGVYRFDPSPRGRRDDEAETVDAHNLVEQWFPLTPKVRSHPTHVPSLNHGFEPRPRFLPPPVCY